MLYMYHLQTKAIQQGRSINTHHNLIIGDDNGNDDDNE